MLTAGKMKGSLNNYFSPIDIHFGNFISSFNPDCLMLCLNQSYLIRKKYTGN